jgi:hypothetical protein
MVVRDLLVPLQFALVGALLAAPVATLRVAGAQPNPIL